MHSRKGFTLIELLVVIAIIGMLASAVSASLADAQREARDKRRVADLKSLQTALELYYVDNQSFPRESEGANGNISTNTTLQNLLDPYMQGFPIDPAGIDNTTFYYYYDGNHTCGGRNYAIIFARQMDKAENSNYTEFAGTTCAGAVASEGRGGGTESYNILLGYSSD